MRALQNAHPFTSCRSRSPPRADPRACCSSPGWCCCYVGALLCLYLDTLQQTTEVMLGATQELCSRGRRSRAARGRVCFGRCCWPSSSPVAKSHRKGARGGRCEVVRAERSEVHTYSAIGRAVGRRDCGIISNCYQREGCSLLFTASNTIRGVDGERCGHRMDAGGFCSSRCGSVRGPSAGYGGRRAERLPSAGCTLP